jgi:hypothetical protein
VDGRVDLVLLVFLEVTAGGGEKACSEMLVEI